MTPSQAIPAPPNSEDSPYDGDFWLAYAANVLLVCSNSLTFRFAEFVDRLGGNEKLAGEIVWGGLIAAILFRLGLGKAIDHHGPRLVWLLSSIVFLAGSGGFLAIDRLSVWLWIARVGYQVGLAGMFSCSIVHIQNQVPPHRRTEIIGSLGSSGFVGTIIGTQLSDLIFNYLEGDLRFIATFGGTALLGLAHALIVFRLTRNDFHHRPDITPGPFKLMFRYWPGAIVLVAVAMGTSFAVTTVFLTRFAHETGLPGSDCFFLPYSLTAFSCRWFMRDWGTTFGRHKMVLWGLAGLATGQMSFLCVTTDWLFLVPALLCGFGHALLFPAVISIGAGRFPVQYRGSGTTLVLGFQELGQAVASPLLGALIVAGNAEGATIGFSWMFIAAAAVAGSIGVFYAATSARHPDRDHDHPRPIAPTPGPVEAESDIGDMVAVQAAVDEAEDEPAPQPER